MKYIIYSLLCIFLFISCGDNMYSNKAKFTVKQQYYFLENQVRTDINEQFYTPQVTVYFNYNKYSLTTQSKNRLLNFISSLNENEKSNVEYFVEGNTDASGRTEYNYILSKQRAREVASFLANNGMSSSNLSILPKGELNPIADNNTTPELNRRVIIYKKN